MQSQRRRTRPFGLLALTMTLSCALTLVGTGRAQPPGGTAKKALTKSAQGKSKLKAEGERASGVIVKVEKGDKAAAKGSDKSAPVRLTINTNAVWRDWARDQINDKPSDTPAKDAEEGKNSVATLGEPADANSIVVVTLSPETKVETRFRALDDEASEGVKAPGSEKAGAPKSVRFGLKDLKAGLFVQADFRTVSAVNQAQTLTVIRPIDENTNSGKGQTAGAKGEPSK